ncbi:glutamine--fructose-6-phosphate transaminase (isomerizing) [Furfurilactobacillus siliginis]|uniref:Glutamine--fructose-6-phosphate aminotransferase [isomerizing] n=1 Tax=Furfurilactobacillus siliginis TaxID=348151 RepID=A0A0R2LDI9_9LACO|nr:glutamine--fructose-6-phosphate transaminase (isomerizing) [Furfurilactobacillus siliginis]KRN96663.1 glucosamine--fructose-6-phosphate aminotransferase [Furfurilactobacillus siliginis]GEK29353.1 glutamine--fructose-6-phosphate aminotransferase [isomerizing] [Furfurilactobacillus siliginis]
MCGIVGVTGNENAVAMLMEGLRRLEYRGYDSAGIYVNDQSGQDYLVKEKGRVADLAKAIDSKVHGSTGIAHTRWATHGQPSIANAHPQVSADGRFYLVHNGVIENYRELTETYLQDVTLASETDTEVVVQLIARFVEHDHITTLEAFRKVLYLIGDSAYGFLLMDREQPDTLYVAKNKSPLLVGVGDDFNVVCSDAIAMLKYTHDFIEMQDGEIMILTPGNVDIEDEEGNHIAREPFHLDMDASEADKGTYPHYMLKEIDDQPAVMRKIVQTYFNEDGEPQIDGALLTDLKAADRLYIVAAGTSWHAGLVGAKLFERLAHVSAEAFVASEFAYDTPMLSEHPFFIFLSQSGETADSREVLTQIKAAGYHSLTLTNVQNSTLSREATYTMALEAGPEIAVASTKAYTAQIAVEAVIAKVLGETLGQDAARDFDLANQLGLVANGIQALVDQKEVFEEIAKNNFVDQRDAFYIGRGIDYALSLEASLKLKEITYIHSEGVAAGELKHGPIALIEAGTPVIGVITQAKTAGLTRSNLAETAARGSHIMTIVSKSLANAHDDIVLEDIDELLSPLLAIIPAQLISYYTSLLKGLDVDKPRNLAKSVTVQ